MVLLYTVAYIVVKRSSRHTTNQHKFVKDIGKRCENSLNPHVKKKMYLAAQAVYAAREVSSQEACWYLLGFPFYFGSKKIVTVNLLPEFLRHQNVISAAELRELPEESVDILSKPNKIATERCKIL